MPFHPSAVGRAFFPPGTLFYIQCAYLTVTLWLPLPFFPVTDVRIMSLSLDGGDPGGRDGG